MLKLLVYFIKQALQVEMCMDMKYSDQDLTVFYVIYLPYGTKQVVEAEEADKILQGTFLINFQ